MKTSSSLPAVTLVLAALLLPLSAARAQHEGHVMPATSAPKRPAQRDTTRREAAASPYQKTPQELLSAPMLEEHLRSLPAPVHDRQIFSFFNFELFEVRFSEGGTNAFVWDFNSWIGGDWNRLWIKSEGEQELTREKTGEGDLQLLYGRLIAPYCNFGGEPTSERSTTARAPADPPTVYATKIQP